VRAKFDRRHPCLPTNKLDSNGWRGKNVRYVVCSGWGGHAPAGAWGWLEGWWGSVGASRRFAPPHRWGDEWWRVRAGQNGAARAGVDGWMWGRGRRVTTPTACYHKGGGGRNLGWCGGAALPQKIEQMICVQSCKRGCSILAVNLGYLHHYHYSYLGG
jgi:hypothetical protein